MEIEKVYIFFFWNNAPKQLQKFKFIPFPIIENFGIKAPLHTSFEFYLIVNFS